MKDFSSTTVKEVTVEEFLEIIINNLVEYLPEKYQDMVFKKREFDKINGSNVGFYMEPKDGTGKENHNVSVVFYINGVYESYSDDSIEDALRSIAYEYEGYMKNVPLTEIENCSAVDFIKENVICQLINADANKKMLVDIPHRRFYEFAIIYRIMLPTVDTSASSVITNALAEKAGISEDELYEYALENIKKEIMILPVNEMLSLLEVISNECAMPDNPLYVVSNQTIMYGAASILYEEKLHELAESLNSDFYLIPSSIHEMLVLPDMGMTPEYIAEMIKMINMEQVKAEERLSNSVYIYNRKNREVSIAIEVTESIL